MSSTYIVVGAWECLYLAVPQYLMYSRSASAMKSNSVWGENRVFNDHHFVHCIIDPSFYNFNGYAHTFIG